MAGPYKELRSTTDSRSAPKSSEVSLSFDGAGSRPLLAIETLAETESAGQATPAPSPLAALWRSIIRLDKGKVNPPAMALRNALAVAIPVAAGFALHNPAAGAAVASGALNVSYSDGVDPYPLRARRMLTWSVLGTVASFSGSAAGPHHFLSITLTAAWAFLAGLLVSISTRAGDLGLNTLVSVVIFSARGPTQVYGAFEAALLVLAGGLLQTAAALLFWPVHRYDPERRAIGCVFADLAKSISSTEEESLTEPLAAAPVTLVQDALTALSRDRSMEGERFRLLFDQADRIRLSGFLVRRLQSFLADQSMNVSGDAAKQNEAVIAGVDLIFENASELLHAVESVLTTNTSNEDLLRYSQRAEELAAGVRSVAAALGPLAAELSSAVDLFTGQLRAVAGLATRSTFDGASDFQLKEAAQPWRLQLQGWLATLTANFSLSSPAFRHGIRMAVFVAVGTAIGHGISWQRNYWLPMTVAVILKPDFTTTFSRGVLRLLGTLVGLLLATALYHAVPSSALPELLLIAVFTFGLRIYGPANYGIFSVAITGLIVFLLAGVGTPPADVVLQRGFNTLAGGCLALLAYGVWPTWERRRVSEVMADMIDATRVYFRAVVTEFDTADGRATDAATAAASQAREAWRRARSVAEASVDRVSSEPRITPRKLSCLNSILASSHVAVHAIMSLEAGLGQVRKTIDHPEAFRSFAHDVEFTLYCLAAALRSSAQAGEDLPRLRDSHTRLVAANAPAGLTDDFVLVETDRLVVTINTLREQVLAFGS